MKKLIVVPTESVNEVCFGASREEVRKEFGKKYKEMKKTPLSKNTMDAYEDFHVFYSEDDKFEAIEIFGKVKVLVEDEKIFPGEKDAAMSLASDFMEDSESYISTSKSIGFSIDSKEKIESILFGCKKYYK